MDARHYGNLQQRLTMGVSGVGPLGRALRFLVGGYLLLVALLYYLLPGIRFNFLGNTYLSNYTSVGFASTATLVFLGFYLLVHRASTTFERNLNKWLGALLANAPPVAVFIVASYGGVAPLSIAVLTYVGIAMVISGWRRDPGCEVMSPANVLMGKQSHFACLIFSPLDWAEKRTRS